MSTYYFLACKTHKEICDGCTSVHHGGWLGNSGGILPSFIYRHRHEECVVEIISEHDSEIDEYQEWTTKAADMIRSGHELKFGEPLPEDYEEDDPRAEPHRQQAQALAGAETALRLAHALLNTMSEHGLSRMHAISAITLTDPNKKPLDFIAEALAGIERGGGGRNHNEHPHLLHLLCGSNFIHY